MLIILLVILAAWEVYWTYHACWIASKLNEKKSFLFFLIFNLLGIPKSSTFIGRKKNILISMNNWVNWVIGICFIIVAVIELFF